MTTPHLPPGYALADQIGRIMDGTPVDIALTALVINLAHTMHLAKVSLEELRPLIMEQLRQTKETMELIGSAH